MSKSESATMSGSASGSESETGGVQPEGLDKMMELLGSDADLGMSQGEESESGSEDDDEPVLDKGKEKAKLAVSCFPLNYRQMWADARSSRIWTECCKSSSYPISTSLIHRL